MNDFKIITEGTRASNSLPTGVDWNFYSSYPKFQNVVSQRQNHILKLISAVLKNQKIHDNIRNRDADRQFELIEEGNDTILDRVNHNIDTLNGNFKNDNLSITNKTIISDSKETPQEANKKIILIHSRNIERPQLKFKTKVDNRPVPFKPLLKYKPNSKIPLDLCLETNEDGVMFYKNPYQYELDQLKIPEEHLKVVPATEPASFEDTKFFEVYNMEQFDLMISDLRSARELAIDLEAHSYRTYQGITCLMQISTRNADYIIDTLELRDKMQVLNEIFTDSAVVKVFHGADSDILWLQRDLGLYVVNMFDTHQAAIILNFSRKSLEFLLKHYCNLDADKSFQLYDWRTRPLSSEAIYYARCDTHYLLYIYDMIKKDLMAMSTKQCNFIELVFQRSTDLCKIRYEVNSLQDSNHLKMYKRSKKMFDIQQMYALQHLYIWRDKLARELDESIGYILPNHMLIKISEMLPKESSGILACCAPIPPLVRQCLHEIHRIIKTAREQTFENSDKLYEENSFTQEVKHIDVDLISLHDYSKLKNENELPTLLNDLNKSVNEEYKSVYIKPQEITIFKEVTKKSRKCIGLTKIIYKQPYELYLKTIKYKNVLKKSQEEKIKIDNNPQISVPSVPMSCSDILFLIPQKNETQMETVDLTIETKEIPEVKVKEDIPEVKVKKNIPEVKVKKDIPEVKVKKDIPEVKVKKNITEVKVKKDIPEVKVKKNITEVKVKKDIPEVKVKKVDAPQQSSSKQNPSNKIQQTNQMKNSNFKPHNYQNTDFSKFHNQSKDIIQIAKRLQKKKNKSKKKNKPKRLQKTV